MSAGAVIGAELIKAVIILLLQEAAKAGMTEAQLIEAVKSERAKLYANDPDKIPV